MEIRQSINNEQVKRFTTSEMEENFLIRDLFLSDKLNLVYTFYDRMIVGGICPVNRSVALEVDEKIIGTTHLLDRREMGIINIGGKGTVKADDKEFVMERREGLYLARGTKNISFESADKSNPGKFYLLSAPAHHSYESKKVTLKEAAPVEAGDIENSNKRTIYKYIHPDGVASCQLVMGMTILAPNNVWNTMPPHTHQRRIEVYQYFDMAEDQLVFHLMGEPEETRHIVVRNEEAVLSPSWSIHSGVGTKNYTFIWGMAGENQTFTDMDGINMKELK